MVPDEGSDFESDVEVKQWDQDDHYHDQSNSPIPRRSRHSPFPFDKISAIQAKKPRLDNQNTQGHPDRETERTRQVEEFEEIREVDAILNQRQRSLRKTTRQSNVKLEKDFKDFVQSRFTHPDTQYGHMEREMDKRFPEEDNRSEQVSADPPPLLSYLESKRRRNEARERKERAMTQGEQPRRKRDAGLSSGLEEPLPQRRRQLPPKGAPGFGSVPRRGQNKGLNGVRGGNDLPNWQKGRVQEMEYIDVDEGKFLDSEQHSQRGRGGLPSGGHSDMQEKERAPKQNKGIGNGARFSRRERGDVIRKQESGQGNQYPRRQRTGRLNLDIELDSNRMTSGNRPNQAFRTEMDPRKSEFKSGHGFETRHNIDRDQQRQDFDGGFKLSNNESGGDPNVLQSNESSNYRFY